jgi:hypothetical protein
LASFSFELLLLLKKRLSGNMFWQWVYHVCSEVWWVVIHSLK